MLDDDLIMLGLKLSGLLIGSQVVYIVKGTFISLNWSAKSFCTTLLNLAAMCTNLGSEINILLLFIKL